VGFKKKSPVENHRRFEFINFSQNDIRITIEKNEEIIFSSKRYIQTDFSLSSARNHSSMHLFLRPSSADNSRSCGAAKVNGFE